MEKELLFLRPDKISIYMHTYNKYFVRHLVSFYSVNLSSGRRENRNNQAKQIAFFGWNCSWIARPPIPITDLLINRIDCRTVLH